jgi:choline dehydrogenase-like flavoprotein
VLASYHPLGTCKMGRDPKTSVVGLDHQTHDVRGLYIVDGSTVPGAPGVNPQLTIMAMATRAAGAIAAAL